MKPRMVVLTATLRSHLGCASRSNPNQGAADGNEASSRTLSNVLSQVALLTTSDASQFANALLALVEGSRVEAGVLPPLTLVDKYGANLAASFGCSVSVALSGATTASELADRRSSRGERMILLRQEAE